MGVEPHTPLPAGWVALGDHLEEWHDVQRDVIERSESADLRAMHEVMHRNHVKGRRALRRPHHHYVP